MKITLWDGDNLIKGSGILFFQSDRKIFSVLTNYHVIETADGNLPLCLVNVYPNAPLLSGALAYQSVPGTFRYFGNQDLAGFDIVPIEDSIGINLFGHPVSKPFDDLRKIALDGNKIKLVPMMDIGEKVFVLGYPDIGGDSLTVTEGIISGVEERAGIGMYYKTSAKIDHGNSGGAAITKRGKFIGVPTFSKSGAKESMAYILAPH